MYLAFWQISHVLDADNQNTHTQLADIIAADSSIVHDLWGFTAYNNSDPLNQQPLL